MVGAVFTRKPARVERDFDGQAHTTCLCLWVGRQRFLIQSVEEYFGSLTPGCVQYKFQFYAPVKRNTINTDETFRLEFFELLILRCNSAIHHFARRVMH